MSFYTITNPQDRNKMINEYLTLQQRIKSRNMKDRINEIYHDEEMNNIYHPILKSTTDASQAVKESIGTLEGKVDEVNKNENKIYLVDTQLGNKVDPYYGIIKYGNKLFMGIKEVHLDDDNIIVDKEKYKLTSGLWSLLTHMEPFDYSNSDYKTYIRIVEQTKVIDNPRNANSNNKPRSTSKFKKFLEPLVEEQENSSGSGIVNFLPSDINSLTKKLNILVGKFNAGNKTTRNEFIAILDNLRERKQISEYEYRTINNFLQ